MLLKKILINLIVLTFFTSSALFFNRALQCNDINSTTNQCKQWSDTIHINYFSQIYFFNYYCFPASTYVMTPQGPKLISQIKIHDKILAYDKETGKSNFSEVMAWLHRDTIGILEYDQIQTVENYKFFSSQAHNIGFVNGGKIGFKFAENLNSGDQLMGFSKNLTVKNAENMKQQKGLFSPMTNYQNFYIFPQNIKYQDLKNSPMLLVHCLSQIQNPLNHEIWIHNILHMLSWFGINEHQNQIHENYIHPISHSLNWFIGNQIRKSHRYSLRISQNHQYIQYDHGYTYDNSGKQRRRMLQKLQSVISYLMMNQIIIHSK